MPKANVTDDEVIALRIMADAQLSREQVVELREHTIPSYLDGLVDAVPWGWFRIVGFTCTFQQSAASFALARPIKARYPNVITIFGGANFEGTMGAELARSVDVVDYAVIGEGDLTLPELLDAFVEGCDPAAVPGLAFRRGEDVIRSASRTPFENMDTLPTPNYDEYFERAEQRRRSCRHQP
jgi:hypothetical protein